MFLGSLKQINTYVLNLYLLIPLFINVIDLRFLRIFIKKFLVFKIFLRRDKLCD